MIRRSAHIIGLAVLVACLVGLTSSGALAAGTPVKQAIVSQIKKIQANPEFKSIATFKIQNKAEAQKAIPKLNALKALYDSAATSVAASTATTKAEKTARTDWVTAVKLNARGIGDLVVGLDAAIKGNKSAGQNDIDKGVKLDATANQEALKAYKLLKISVR